MGVGWNLGSRRQALFSDQALWQASTTLPQNGHPPAAPEGWEVLDDGARRASVRGRAAGPRGGGAAALGSGGGAGGGRRARARGRLFLKYQVGHAASTLHLLVAGGVAGVAVGASKRGAPGGSGARGAGGGSVGGQCNRQVAGLEHIRHLGHQLSCRQGVERRAQDV